MLGGREIRGAPDGSVRALDALLTHGFTSRLITHLYREKESMSWFTKKPSSGTAMNAYYFGDSTLPEKKEAGKNEVVVNREDHYMPFRPTSYSWLPLVSLYPETFKSGYERKTEKLDEVRVFLEDLRTIFPEITERFNASPAPELDEDADPFRWDFKGAHAAADLLRSDADEKVKRDAVKKFQGK